MFIISDDMCGYLKFTVLTSTLNFIQIKKKTKQFPKEFKSHDKFSVTLCCVVPVLSDVL